MRALDAADPLAAAGIRARAVDYARRIEPDFPGDWSGRTITDNVAWRDWFYDRHRGLACPALGTEGACLLHEYRPVCCRLYGPLIQIGDKRSDPCPLNYIGLTPQEIESRAVRLALPRLDEPAEPETMIVFALLQD